MREPHTLTAPSIWDAVKQEQHHSDDSLKSFGFVTTVAENSCDEKIKIKIKYSKNNFFSTPETNMLAQISQLSCGKTILDFI